MPAGPNLTIRLEGLEEAARAIAGAGDRGQTLPSQVAEAAREAEVSEARIRELVREQLDRRFRRERRDRKARENRQGQIPRNLAGAARSGAAFVSAATSGDPAKALMGAGSALQKILATQSGGLGATARFAGKAAGGVVAGVALFRAGTGLIAELEPIVLGVLKKAGINTDVLDTLKKLGDQTRRVEAAFEAVPRAASLVSEIASSAALVGVRGGKSRLAGLGARAGQVEFAQAQIRAGTAAREKFVITQNRNHWRTLIEQGNSATQILQLVQRGALVGRR